MVVHAETEEIAKCPSGIGGLDEVLAGGFPAARPTLVCGGPGCGKTTLAMEFIARGAAEYDEPGVFFSFEERREDLLSNYASMSWDLAGLVETQMVRLDDVRIRKAEIRETGGFDLEGLFIRLESAIDAVNARRVVLDTVEVLFSAFESSGIIRSELQRLFEWLKEKQVTAVVTGERGEAALTRGGLEEYVSDCVISLDQPLHDRVSTRRMRVVKYRGSSHGSNVYPFLIGADGISIFPLTSLGLDYPVSSARVSSGIEALDEMLGGEGFYRGSSILLTGTAGTGKSSCAATLVDSACQRGERCVYASFEESPDQIIRNMRSIGIDLARWAENGTLKFAAERPYRHGLERHLLRLKCLVDDFDPQVFVVDPISNLTEVGRTWQARDTLTRLIDFLKGRRVTALFTSLTQGQADVEQTQTGVSSLMDSWLLLRDVERDGERNNVLHILKSRGMEHSKQVREFQFSDDGIRLVDVYMGPEGVLTGTARYTQEMREEMESEQRRREVEADRKRLQELRELSQARIESIRAECRAEERKIEQRIRQQELEQKLDEEARKHRRQMRGGGKDND